MAQQDTLEDYCKTKFTSFTSQTSKGEKGNYIYYVTDNAFYFVFDSKDVWVRDSLKIFEPLFLNNIINCKIIKCFGKGSDCKSSSSPYTVKKKLFSKNDTTYDNYIFEKKACTQILIHKITFEYSKLHQNKMIFNVEVNYSGRPNTCWWTFELSMLTKGNSLSDFINKGKLTCIGGPGCEI